MKKQYYFIIAYFLFIAGSFLFKFESGIAIAHNFISFFMEMLKILPLAFLLIGLFEVWVDRKIIEKHLGENSLFLSYFWVILLAGTIVGGLYVAIPLAFSLLKKGAKVSVIFTFLGAAAVCRIPMTVFEATFLGLKFTIIRFLVSLPLIIFSSILLEQIVKKI